MSYSPCIMWMGIQNGLIAVEDRMVAPQKIKKKISNSTLAYIIEKKQQNFEDILIFCVHHGRVHKIKADVLPQMDR